MNDLYKRNYKFNINKMNRIVNNKVYEISDTKLLFYGSAFILCTGLLAYYTEKHSDNIYNVSSKTISLLEKLIKE